MAKNNEVAKVDYSLPAVGGAMGEAFAEEMDGLTLSFPRVKDTFRRGLGLRVRATTRRRRTWKEIIGVIVDHHATLGRTSTRRKRPPDCASIDGELELTLTVTGNPVIPAR